MVLIGKYKKTRITSKTQGLIGAYLKQIRIPSKAQGFDRK